MHLTVSATAALFAVAGWAVTGCTANTSALPNYTPTPAGTLTLYSEPGPDSSSTPAANINVNEGPRVCTYGPYKVTLYYDCPAEDPLAGIRDGNPVLPSTPVPAPTRTRIKAAPARPPQPTPPAILSEPTHEIGGTLGQDCTPGYDPCLPPAYDYDCKGGGGNGPAYTGTVRVFGPDIYGLDGDNDGIGCE